jgi:uncharacterized iron-regulated membrane protein
LSIRPFFFWIHLIAGLVCGLVILVMSVTGVLLTYERQMLAWADRGPWQSAPPDPGARRLSVAALVDRAREQRPDLPANATLTLRSDPREPVEISLGREGALYLQPYTGQLLGGSSARARKLFADLRVWHRWLGTAGGSASRETAKAITGAANLAFLFLVCSGLYLWFPRKWASQAFGAVAWFRGGLHGKARDFNWHNVIGLWTAVPLFFIVITAVPFSYKWGNDLVFRLAGTPVPGGAPRPEPELPRQTPVIDLANVEPLLAQAAGRTPDWRSISFRISDAPGAPMSFTIDSGDGGQPQKRATLLLDRATGSTLKWEPFESLSAGRRLRSWTRFIHTGEAYGLTGQTLAGVASLGGVLLVWTGISLSLRRFAAWRARQARDAIQLQTSTATVSRHDSSSRW